MANLANFSPFEALAERLLPFAIPNGLDGAHDIAQITRVWTNVRAISKVDGGDLELLIAATLLHDCVSIEKDSPDRTKASSLAAKAARIPLRGLNWDNAKIDQACHAIEAHSFSANIAPTTLEARILQDADRLDAIGLIGVARCFYVAGRMASALYDPNDPRAENRALDDRSFAIDHFETKLLTLADSFQTSEGQRLAKARHEELLAFHNAFLTQVGAYL
ncbi:HD domain-containing protein [Planktotalea sp.]|uniref:HD domain-containing protein n=1 Tax=Planktotalea sp. TaxID=2029877 RepID=UPI0025E0E8BD|nr:HD domain-containing protein [Planktotalea sp.]